ncbi:MAG: hypothetical protein KDK34_00940, partial [Leptospiraceae bacterium]|nr:hypothetical protein [Leptospiraceae bacterium]
PYIHPDEATALQPDVRDYEPAMALFCDPAGNLLARLIAEAAGHLRSGGRLYMEIADRWAAHVLSAAQSHFGLSELRTDYAGQVRFLHARR